MAPPSAQKALSTSTRMSAVCAGSAFWGSVVSMGDILSGLPDHGVDVERLCELLAHQDVEVGLQGGDVELGDVERQGGFLSRLRACRRGLCGSGVARRPACAVWA